MTERLSGTELARLLAGTSRTFAITIPLLPEPLATEITIAYLLFRTADTIEDHPTLSSQRKDDRLAYLDRQLTTLSFGRAVGQPSGPLDSAPAGASSAASFPGGALSVGGVSPGAWPGEGSAEFLGSTPDLLTDGVPSGDAACDELLACWPRLAESLRFCEPSVRTVIVASVRETIAGMRQPLQAAAGPGAITLTSLPELREYCYVVAGLVGEMLTELFLARVPALAPSADRLRRAAPDFGEALQLVNILKDVTDDAAAGRRWLPPTVDPAEVFALARADLRRAEDYVAILRDGGAPPGVTAFADLPRRLAERTLDTVERHGPGRKLPRQEVAEILRDVRRTSGLDTADSSETVTIK